MGTDFQMKPATKSELTPANDATTTAPRNLPHGTGEPKEARFDLQESVHLAEDVRVVGSAQEQVGGEEVDAGLAAEVVGTADYAETLSLPTSHWGLKKMGLESGDGLLDQQAA